MIQTYCLSPGVHSCCTGEFCVFLDLQRDQYVSVNTNSLIRVATRIRGLGISHETSSSAANPPARASDSLLDELSAAQLITQGSCCTHAPEGTAISPPSDDLTSVRTHCAPPEGAAHLAQLTKALCRAHLQLSRRPIAEIVADVQRRKQQHHATDGGDNVKQTLALAFHFSKYRFFYPKNYLCLFDSLALLLYLSRYHLYPTWVFGVREAPFFAHCWVQMGPIVLSDYRDRVIPFTPIMVI